MLSGTRVGFVVVSRRSEVLWRGEGQVRGDQQIEGGGVVAAATDEKQGGPYHNPILVGYYNMDANKCMIKLDGL